MPPDVARARVRQTKDAPAPHKGQARYLAGMPAQLGGHNVYAGQMAAISSWLKNRHFCPTDNAFLRGKQTD